MATRYGLMLTQIAREALAVHTELLVIAIFRGWLSWCVDISNTTNRWDAETTA